MPTTALTPIKKLKLDLENFRTVPQKNEVSAIQAIVSISPGPFWALMESLIDDGYLPTESILVQRGPGERGALTVKEGNRRLAALKVIHGLISLEDFDLPSDIKRKIEELPRGWKSENANVPCTIYEQAESKTVERIRALTHGKDEKAGRDGWKAVARARHNRNENGASEPGLDLLEKYIVEGKNITATQKQRWTGDYPLTVLDEAIKRLAPRLGLKNAPDLAASYPKIKQRDVVEKIIHDIGLENIGFKGVRTEDFGTAYGVPPQAEAKDKGSAGSKLSAESGAPAASGAVATKVGTSTSSAATKTGGSSGKTTAVAVNDPRQVARTLKSFKPKGKNREKVVTLLDELKLLKLDKNPLAFCFVLRSIFEISAKVYCADHSSVVGAPKMTKANGDDKSLADGLRDIVKYLTGGNTRTPEAKALHGAMAELGNANGFLSVTSMNQLVHNPRFVVSSTHIAVIFGNVFPLLETMNT